MLSAPSTNKTTFEQLQASSCSICRLHNHLSRSKSTDQDAGGGRAQFLMSLVPDDAHQRHTRTQMPITQTHRHSVTSTHTHKSSIPPTRPPTPGTSSTSQTTFSPRPPIHQLPAEQTIVCHNSVHQNPSLSSHPTLVSPLSKFPILMRCKMHQVHLLDLDAPGCTNSLDLVAPAGPLLSDLHQEVSAKRSLHIL